jgi:putative ABC transport system permease protein
MAATSLRYAVRRWRHRPVLAITATLILALGIAATTAMFSIVNAVVLKDEPWPDAERIVRVYGVNPTQRSNPAYAKSWNRGGVSWASWRDLQKLPEFSAVAAFVAGDYLIGDENPEVVRAFFASSELAALAGVRPNQGRFFNAREDDVDSGTVILSHDLWQRRFGGDPKIVGSTTTVTSPGESGRSPSSRRVIVGVLPPDFSLPGETPDLLLPIGYHKYNGSFGTPFFMVLAKIAPDSSISGAERRAEPLVRREEALDRRTGRVVGVRTERVGFGDRPLWLMLAGAALLLIVACSNVAGLLLSDARSRHHEMAVRLALGGSRFAILKQITAEHAVLAVAAAASGVLLANWLIPALTTLTPPGLLGSQDVTLDRTLALWSVAAAVITTMVAGLIPSAAISGTKPADALKTGGRESTVGGRWRHRVVVALQFALALVLLAGAALFGETLIRLRREPLGFAPEGVAVASLVRGRQAAPVLTKEAAAKYVELRRTNTAALDQWMAQTEWTRILPLLDRMRAVPGVKALALTQSVPFTSPAPSGARVHAEGQPANSAIPVFVQAASAEYFPVLGISIVRGRNFEPSDRQPGARSAIVSAELERRLFPSGARGRKLLRDKTAYDVIGVVGDVKHQALTEELTPMMYLDLRQPSIARHLVVRTDGDVGSILPAIRSAIESDGGGGYMFATSSAALSDLVASTMLVESGRATLSALYGAAALVLATVGLYGLAARLVAERRREIGIRVALGAGRRHVRRLVMRDAWLIVGIGLIVGIPVAIAASQFAQGMLYGVEPRAPHVLGICAVALGVAAIFATTIPAWRASRIDPALTLREE